MRLLPEKEAEIINGRNDDLKCCNNKIVQDENMNIVEKANVKQLMSQYEALQVNSETRKEIIIATGAALPL
jgi:hypothetical protein